MWELLYIIIVASQERLGLLFNRPLFVEKLIKAINK